MTKLDISKNVYKKRHLVAHKCIEMSFKKRVYSLRIEE